jgi:hypothetical protein
MYTWNFFLGVIFALVSGVINNLGTLLQKKAVNEYLKKRISELSSSGELVRDEKYSAIKMSMKELMLNKTWLFGFTLQLVVATGLFIVAQIMIGPSLTPAIGSFGLIVVVFASCLVQEKLTWDEYVGIFIMTVAVFFLGLSDLQIDASKTDFLDPWFMLRVGIFTFIIIAMGTACEMWSWKKDKNEGTMLALLSGLCIALSNFWVSPLTALLVGLIKQDGTNPTFQHHHLASIVLYVIFTFAVVIVSNVLAIYERQLAFRVGHAATMIPISHIPSHLSSPLIYSLVFWLPAPTSYALALMWIGIVLLLISSFIFGKREAMFEQRQRLADKDPGEEGLPLV